MRSFAGIVVVLSLVSLAGCGGSAEMSPSSGEKMTGGAPMADSIDMPASTEAVVTNAALPEEQGQAEIGQDGKATPATPDSQVQRQIIYTARLSLVVEEFDGVPEQVEKLTASHGGFVANSNLQGSSGSPRHGSWTIRIPVRQYGTFLDAAKSIGEFQSLSVESQEVTAEFYDVLARIKNKQRQEQRLIELLEKATGKLEEILRVEEQIARVREEIERMQGRIRVLKDLTSFSTVTLTIQEIKGYQPPAAPTFGNRVARAWEGTLTALLKTGQNLVIFIVVVGPWLVILSIPVILFIALLRMLIRKRVAR